MMMVWNEGLAVSLTCLPAFPQSEGLPSCSELWGRGWLMAAFSLPTHSSFERCRCASGLVLTSVMHTEEGCSVCLQRQEAYLGFLKIFFWAWEYCRPWGLLEQRSLVHWGYIFFSCLIVKFLFTFYFILFLHKHLGGTKHLLNDLCS